jgi:RHS repeat-associated protein
VGGGAGDWDAGSPTKVTRFVWSGWLMLLELDGLSDCGTPGAPAECVVRKYTWGLDLAGQNGQVNSLESAGAISGLLAAYDPAANLPLWYFYDANGNVTQLVAWASTVQDDSETALGNAWDANRIAAHYEYGPYGNVLNDLTADDDLDGVPDAGAYAAENPWRFSTKQWDCETGLLYFGLRYRDRERWINRDPIEERGGINLFAYVGNRPVSLIDPVGLDSLDDWAIGQARLRAAFWHYMFGGYGDPWYRDDWAPEVQELAGYKSLVNGLTTKIRKAACANHSTAPCDQEQSEHFSDNFDAESAWNKPSLMPLGRFIIWAEADCRFTRSCSDCKVRHRCTVNYEVRDPFDFDGGFDEEALMFVTKILNGVPRTLVLICGIFDSGCREMALDEMGEGGHPFTIYIRWRDVINGEICCDGQKNQDAQNAGTK